MCKHSSFIAPSFILNVIYVISDVPVFCKIPENKRRKRCVVLRGTMENKQDLEFEAVVQIPDITY